MKVAINASILAGPVTGIANYLLAALSRLSAYEQHTFFVYLSDDIDLNQLVDTLGDNVVIRSSRIKSRLGKKIWEQLMLPRWTRLDEVDVFWSPSHHLPLLLPKRVKTVVTIHDIVWKLFPETMPLLNCLAERILMPLSLAASDAIVAVSKSTAGDVIKYWPSFSDKVVVTYPAFNIPKVQVLKEKGSTLKGNKYLLFVGTIEPRKNLRNLMKAYLQLPKLISESYPLVIVGGNGWGASEELKLMQQQRPQSIKFSGYVTDEELTTLYKDASLFIMPSLYEGFGLSLVEAMYYGLPVITSSCSSMSEVVGTAAITVDPHDVDSISNAIQNVLTDGVLQESLKVKSKARANELLSMRSVDELVQIFENV